MEVSVHSRPVGRAGVPGAMMEAASWVGLQRDALLCPHSLEGV